MENSNNVIDIQPHLAYRKTLRSIKNVVGGPKVASIDEIFKAGEVIGLTRLKITDDIVVVLRTCLRSF